VGAVAHAVRIYEDIHHALRLRSVAVLLMDVAPITTVVYCTYLPWVLKAWSPWRLTQWRPSQQLPDRAVRWWRFKAQLIEERGEKF
jgi:hypothetical protein